MAWMAGADEGATAHHAPAHRWTVLLPQQGCDPSRGDDLSRPWLLWVEKEWRAALSHHLSTWSESKMLGWRG